MNESWSNLSKLTEHAISAMETPMLANRIARIMPGSSLSSTSCCAVLFIELFTVGAAGATTSGAGAADSFGVSHEGESLVAMVKQVPKLILVATAVLVYKSVL
jgi:hypothetical protein